VKINDVSKSTEGLVAMAITSYHGYRGLNYTVAINTSSHLYSESIPLLLLLLYSNPLSELVIIISVSFYVSE
jgi:hypothetical protein